MQNPIPRRVLVVDDDELIRESLSTLLKSADFEVTLACDGAEALTLQGRQHYPVVVTDRAMPVIDGIEFVQRLRAIEVSPTYIIMLTVSTDAQDFERGYCAGVDHYIAKKGYEAGLAAKVNAGLISLRRRHFGSISQGDEPVTVDLESGAHTARHLVGRLHAEIAHTARVKKPLSVMSVCIESAAASRSGSAALSVASEALLRSVYSSVRPKLDWVARLPAANNSCRLAVVMPAAAGNEVAAVETSIRNAFVRSADEPAMRDIKLTMGAAQLTGEEASPTSLELLGESERQRRGVGPRKQVDIRSVQGGEHDKTDENKTESAAEEAKSA